MFAVLLGSLIASGLIIRGAWDLWSQSLILIVFLTAAATWLGIRIASGYLPQPNLKVLSWVAVLAGLSTLSVWASPVPAYSHPAWAAAAIGLALFPFISMLESSGRARLDLFIRAATLVLVLLAFYQRFYGEIRPSAMFLNQNVFAGAILLLLPAAFCAGNWALTAGLLVCLWWTRSVGAWLALFIVLVLHRRAAGILTAWLSIAGGLVGLMVVYAKFHSPEAQHRIDWWKAAWRMSVEAPWLGLGPGSYAYALPAYVDQRPELSSLFAHQHYLETAAEHGWPYALLWIAGLAVLLKPAPAARRFGPIAALISGFADYALSVPGVFWLFCASTALAIPESSRSVNIPLRWRPALCASVVLITALSVISIWRGWSAECLRGKAIVNIRAGRLEEAAGQLADSEALSAHPEAARLRAELILERGGERSLAAAHLKRAVALDPYRASTRALLNAVSVTREH